MNEKKFLLSSEFFSFQTLKKIDKEFAFGSYIILYLFCVCFMNGGSINLSPLNNEIRDMSNNIREMYSQVNVELSAKFGLSTIWEIIHRSVEYGIFVEKDFENGVLRPSKRFAKQDN